MIKNKELALIGMDYFNDKTHFRSGKKRPIDYRDGGNAIMKFLFNAIFFVAWLFTFIILMMVLLIGC